MQELERVSRFMRTFIDALQRHAYPAAMIALSPFLERTNHFILAILPGIHDPAEKRAVRSRLIENIRTVEYLLSGATLQGEHRNAFHEQLGDYFRVPPRLENIEALRRFVLANVIQHNALPQQNPFPPDAILPVFPVAAPVVDAPIAQQHVPRPKFWARFWRGFKNFFIEKISPFFNKKVFPLLQIPFEAIEWLLRGILKMPATLLMWRIPSHSESQEMLLNYWQYGVRDVWVALDRFLEGIFHLLKHPFDSSIAIVRRIGELWSFVTRPGRIDRFRNFSYEVGIDVIRHPLRYLTNAALLVGSAVLPIKVYYLLAPKYAARFAPRFAAAVAISPLRIAATAAAGSIQPASIGGRISIDQESIELVPLLVPTVVNEIDEYSHLSEVAIKEIVQFLRRDLLRYDSVEDAAFYSEMAQEIEKLTQKLPAASQNRHPEIVEIEATLEWLREDLRNYDLEKDAEVYAGFLQEINQYEEQLQVLISKQEPVAESGTLEAFRLAKQHAIDTGAPVLEAPVGFWRAQQCQVAGFSPQFQLDSVGLKK